MGWFDDDEKKKKEEQKKKASIFDLFDEEINEINDNGYEPEDFEDDEIEEGDYYSDEL